MTTLPLRVRINQWVAAGDDELLVNGEGFVIDPTGFKGWDDGVDVRLNKTEYPAAAGSFDTVGYPDSRIVALGGSCWADSPQKTAWFGDQLTGLLANGGSALVNVDHQGGTLYGYARLASKPTFVVSGADARDAVWGLQLFFANPRKFGDEQAFGPGTTVVVDHRGNFDAAPILSVAGIMGSGYTIAGPDGKTFVVTTPVTSGHAHSIDMASGLLRIDGVIIYGGISQGDTWTVPPGETVSMTLTPAAGSGLMVARVKDTSI